MKKEISSRFLGILGNILWNIIKFLWKIFLFCLVGILQLIALLSDGIAKWLKKDILHINN